MYSCNTADLYSLAAVFWPQWQNSCVSWTLLKVVYLNTYTFYCCQLRAYLPVKLNAFWCTPVLWSYTLWNLTAGMVGAKPSPPGSLTSLCLLYSSCPEYLHVCLRLWPFLSMNPRLYFILTLTLYSLSYILRNAEVNTVVKKFWVKRWLQMGSNENSIK